VIRDLGIPTANFEIVESEADIKPHRPSLSIICKTSCRRQGKGIDLSSKVSNYDELKKNHASTGWSISNRRFWLKLFFPEENSPLEY